MEHLLTMSQALCSLWREKREYGRFSSNLMVKTEFRHNIQCNPLKTIRWEGLCLKRALTCGKTRVKITVLPPPPALEPSPEHSVKISSLPFKKPLCRPQHHHTSRSKYWQDPSGVASHVLTNGAFDYHRNLSCSLACSGVLQRSAETPAAPPPSPLGHTCGPLLLLIQVKGAAHPTECRVWTRVACPLCKRSWCTLA